MRDYSKVKFSPNNDPGVTRYVTRLPYKYTRAPSIGA
jgi:hypothetical protein